MNSFVQVAVPILDGENYLRWSSQMRVLFDYHDLLTIVEVGVPMLAENATEVQRNAHQEDTKKDRKALYFILQGLTDEIFKKISDASTAKQAWDILMINFKDVDRVQRSSGNMDKELLDAVKSKDGANDMRAIKEIYEEDRNLLYGTTTQGNTALHLAIRFGKRHLAEQIHELCPSLLRHANVAGDTPLHCVAASGWPDMLRWAGGVIDNIPSIDNVKGMFRMRNRQGETALHVALKNGNETMAKSLLRKDFGLSDCINNEGESVIYLAANFGYFDIVKELLKSPSTANHKGLLGRSPLHGAIRAGNIDVVEAILEERPEDVKRTDEGGRTPLHYAVSLNHVRLVEILLSCDASAAYDVDMVGNSPAHIAAQMGFIEVLDKILGCCPDCVDVVDAKGRNILHVAADSGKLHVAKHILASRGLGGVVNQQDANGDTLLHIASSKREANVLKQLITVDHMLNRRVENRKGHTAIESLPQEANEEVCLKYNSGNMHERLLSAAISKDTDAVHVRQWLHREDPELLRGTTAQRNTALHLAIKFGNHHFAARIHGLCPDLLGWQNVNGETPLHCAAACGWPHIWNWAANLIRSPNVNDDDVRRMFRMRNSQGETALHVALKNDNETIARSFLNADSGLSDCIDNAGESVIYLAANFGHLDIVNMLLEPPSTADHTGLLGRSPLHAAIRAENIDVVRTILEKRPGDVKRTDEIGSTPLHYAVSQNHVHLVEMLLERDRCTAYDVATDGNSPAHLAAQMGFVKVLDKILDYSPDCIDMVDANGRNALHVAIDSGKVDVAKHILSRYGLRGVVNQQDANGDTPLHIASSKCEANVLKELIMVDHILNKRVENHKGRMAIESLPQEVNEEVYLKYVKVGRMLPKVYSKDATGMVETHRKKLLDTTRRFRHTIYARRMEKKSMIAALISAVTFMAAFAVPGGYFDDEGPDQGLAILTKKSAFKAFIVFDTLAMILSLTMVILTTSTNIWAGKYSTGILLITNGLSAISLIAVTLAFGTGVYVVLAPLSLALASTILTLSCLLFVIFVYYIKGVYKTLL